MKNIEYAGLRITKEVAVNGLKVLIIEKKGFQKIYAGIGVNYGSNDFNFIYDGKNYKTKPGIAHFIEHKLFEMPNGVDSFQLLTNLGVTSNAYTSNDKTCYFFNATKEIINPLKILLEFVFTPYFNEESVNREKGIIKSEIKMYEDYPDYQLETEVLKKLYKNSGISEDIAGKVEDIDSTTITDIMNNYNAFYTGDNMCLTIIGDVKPLQIINIVNDTLKKFPKTDSSKTKKNNGIDRSSSDTNLTYITANISNKKFQIGLRLPIPSKNLSNRFEEDFMFDAICNCLFNESSKYYQKLLENDLITNSFQYQMIGSSNYRTIILGSESEKPEQSVKEILNKIENLTKNDIEDEDLNIYKKALLGSTYKYYDNISGLGDLVLSYELLGIDYFDKIEYLKKLTYKNINDYIEIFKKSIKTSVIMTNNQ